MALEQRVYEELTAIDPKVLAGLTVRQLIAAGLTVLLGGALIVAMWLSGQRSGFTYLILPVAVPLMAWSWFKPKGLRLDAWAVHAWRYWKSPTKRYYGNFPVWEWEQEQEGRRYVVGKQVEGWTEAGQ